MPPYIEHNRPGHAPRDISGFGDMSFLQKFGLVPRPGSSRWGGFFFARAARRAHYFPSVGKRTLASLARQIKTDSQGEMIHRETL